MKRIIETLPILLLVPGFNFAQSRQSDWDNLRQLAPGQSIRIVLNDAESCMAEFRGVTTDALVVRLAQGDQTLQRHSVLRVSTQHKSHRGRNALIGVAAGIGAGIIVGVASPELGQGKCSHGSCVDAGQVSALGVAGATAGAVVGAVIPRGGWHNVYRAR
jgi:hypothetical protein